MNTLIDTSMLGFLGMGALEMLLVVMVLFVAATILGLGIYFGFKLLKQNQRPSAAVPPTIQTVRQNFPVCPQCGRVMTPDSPQGICPACLMKAGLGSQFRETGEPAKNSGPVMSLSELASFFPQLELIELLGQGGMGSVYKARQPQLDRLVALKILSPQLSRDPAFAERFSREAKALARLNHPNIVGVYDFGKANDLYYFIMEYVDGMNLWQLEQSKKRLSPEEAFVIVPKICDALQYAHDEGVVHRDITPGNILIDKKGRVKIADFGLAKLLGKEPQPFGITQSRMTMGTPHYMAPEQIEKPLDVDHRADIYSLGVVFYEMLTGELPIGRFAPPSQKVQVDVRLDEVVLRTLEKEPQRRYQQASDVKTDVETVAGIRSGAAAASHRTPQSGGRQNMWKTGAVIFLFSLLMILFLWYVNSLHSPRIRDTYSTRRQVAAPQPAAEPLVLDNADAVFEGDWLDANWNQNSPLGKDRFGKDYKWRASRVGPGQPAATATYFPKLETPGAYDVEIWYASGTNRSHHVLWIISSAERVEKVVVDQTRDGGRWVKIGTALPFIGDGGEFVRLESLPWDNSLTEAGRVIVADAVRFVPVSTPSSSTSANSTDAQRVIASVISKYKSLQTLRVRGRTVTGIRYQDAEGREPFNVVSSFSIHLQRSNLCLVKWEEAMTSGYVGKGAVWSDGKNPFMWIGEDIVPVRNLKTALESTRHASSEASSVVPDLFFDYDGNWLLRLENPVFNPAEELDGDACHVISGILDGEKILVWIRKTDFLIKQRQRVLNMSTTSIPVATDEQIAKIIGPSANAQRIANWKLQCRYTYQAIQQITAVKTETFQLIEADQVISPTVFVQPVWGEILTGSSLKPVKISANSPAIWPRANTATGDLLDLSARYNLGLHDDLGSKTLFGNNLVAIPHGVRTFAGTKFDVRGIVQLSGQTLEQFIDCPKAITDLPVARKASRIHILWGVCWREEEGSTVAKVVLHLNGQQTRELALNYGENVRDCAYISDQNEETSRATVAWAGRNVANRIVRVYKTTLENPLPDIKVQTLDFVSTMSNCAPFVLGVTVE